MTRLRIFFHRLLGLFLRRKLERELEEEIRSHLEMQIEDNLRQGMSPEDARRAARLRFGGVEQVKEAYRDKGRLGWIESLWQDLRYAIRSLFRNPVFSVVVLLTLAIGIGSTTAIFSVVYALLLKPLPYPDSDRLVRLIVIQSPGPPGQSSTGGPQRVPGGINVRELTELRSRMRSVSAIGVYNVARMTMTGGGEASRLEGMVISASIWQAIGARPLLGRVFDATEADPVIVLSNRAWKRFFQGDPGVIGRNIVLGGNNYTVIGVMPEEFTFANLQSEFWIPIGRSPSAAGAFLARLSDGVSLQTASAEVNTILHELRPQARTATFELSREQDEIVGPVRRPVLILMAAVALVLLIACVNVANLLLARSVARRREVAIRIALGAGRGRLMQQYLAEGAVLSLAGGALGVALAYGGVRLLRSLASTLYRTDLGGRLSFPRIEEVGINADVLAFALCLSMGASLLFGLAPVLSRL
ncbi:MAG TPA: ABC transporter permease, partial [Blastocatellia bacterium]|nr:ABC transporter permease [Blastocatellia bacterium]